MDVRLASAAIAKLTGVACGLACFRNARPIDAALTAWAAGNVWSSAARSAGRIAHATWAALLAWLVALRNTDSSDSVADTLLAAIAKPDARTIDACLAQHRVAGY